MAIKRLIADLEAQKKALHPDEALSPGHPRLRLCHADPAYSAYTHDNPPPRTGAKTVVAHAIAEMT
jgi:hypothetical protein